MDLDIVFVDESMMKIKKTSQPDCTNCIICKKNSKNKCLLCCKKGHKKNNCDNSKTNNMTPVITFVCKMYEES